MNTTETEQEPAATAIFSRDEHYFGACSKCKSMECVDVGRDHYGMCRLHKIRWYIGNNLFSGWHWQTPEEKEQAIELLETCVDVTMTGR